MAIPGGGVRAGLDTDTEADEDGGREEEVELVDVHDVTPVDVDADVTSGLVPVVGGCNGDAETGGRCVVPDAG